MNTNLEALAPIVKPWVIDALGALAKAIEHTVTVESGNVTFTPSDALAHTTLAENGVDAEDVAEYPDFVSELAFMVRWNVKSKKFLCILDGRNCLDGTESDALEALFERVNASGVA